MSYLEINSVEMPSPITIDSKMARVQIAQRAYGGLKRRNMAVTAGYKVNTMSLNIEWDGINATELALIKTAWNHCSQNTGVLLKAGDLRLPTLSGAFTDSCYVTVFPDTGLNVEFLQEYDDQGNGPLLYRVMATFLAAPERYS